MKKRKNIFLGILVSVIGLTLFMFLFQFAFHKQQNTDVTNSKINISASIFPIADIAKNIGGEKVTINQILPSGSSPHTFELSPSKITAIGSSDLVLAVGHDLDNWIIDSVEDQQKIIVIDENIELIEFTDTHETGEVLEHDEEGENHDHDNEEEHGHNHEGLDPHYWLSVKNAKIIANNITNELILLDPENKDYYLSNQKNYLNELDELAWYINNKSESMDDVGIITFHNAFNYFAEENGITILANIEAFPGIKPTLKEIDSISEIIKKYDVSVLYNEPQLSDKDLSVFVEEYGVEIVTIDPLGGNDDNPTYIDMMKNNTDKIFAKY